MVGALSLLALICSCLRYMFVVAINPHILRWIAVFLLLVGGLAFLFYVTITAQLNPANDVATYWRSLNLFTGVSPLLPLLFLIVGGYGWFWFTLGGMALFNDDRPQLPSREVLKPMLRGLSCEDCGTPLEAVATPLGGNYIWRILVSLGFVLLVARIVLGGFTLRSLGAAISGRVFFLWLSLYTAVMLADVWQMMRTWTRLHRLLIYLDRLPLRRTLVALKGFSWGSVWKMMSGNVVEQRYRLLARQMESLHHLQNQMREESFVDEDLEKAMANCDECQGRFLAWFQKFYDKDKFGYYGESANKVALRFSQFYQGSESGSEAGFLDRFVQFYKKQDEFGNMRPLENYQLALSDMSAAVMNGILLPGWQKEKKSLLSGHREFSNATPGELVQAAEEFFVLLYLGFIQNILGRIRTMASGIFFVFIAATLCVASYPFDPRPALSGLFLAVFVLLATVIVYIFAEMHRDATLSRITDTKPGELGADFWIKLVTLGIGPVLGLLTAVFPEIAGFVTSWIQPSVQSIH